MNMRWFGPCWALALLASSARAEVAPPLPVTGIDVEEHLGRAVPLGVPLTDSTGRQVSLAELVSGERPIVLTLAYFDCPMLCSLVLSATSRALQLIDARPGRDVDLVTVSFNPHDGPADAAAKRRNYLQAGGLADRPDIWPFLTGREPDIRAVADALGFRYEAVVGTSEFAHPAVIFILTPGGVLSRYLYGIEYPERDLRLALAEASQGRSGNSFDRFLLHCFRYDPATRRYGFYISTYLRVGGLLVFASIVGLIAFLRSRETTRLPS